MEYSNRLDVPLNEGSIFVDNCLRGIGVRDKVRIICSGKVATGYDMIEKLAPGADMCNSARAVKVPQKRVRVHRCHDATLESFRELLGAMRREKADDLHPADIFRRTADEQERTYSEPFTTLPENALNGENIPIDFAPDWNRASANQF